MIKTANQTKSKLQNSLEKMIVLQDPFKLKKEFAKDMFLYDEKQEELE